ncbi:MAG: cyclic nucleotide-binding domain-containing protein [Spirochaetales bacterium]|nr:cyclic nucleotide-binding domain-containing protein [Spirochaetales bacterium]
MKISKDGVIEKIKKIPFFKEIKENDDYINQIVGIIKVKRVNQGSSIIKEGELGSELFILYEGNVEIQKKTRAGDNYTVVSLRAEDNVFFGEMCLIDDEKRSATVMSSTDTILLVIRKEDFIQLGNNYPQISLPITRAISQILSSRLRKTTEDMLTLFDALVNEIKG